MDLQLKNRLVMISGGSRGIGLACAHAFLEEGARLALVSRNQENLQAAHKALLQAHPEAEGKIACYQADLTDAHAANSVIEAAELAQGAIDILVNSAGAAQRTPAAELSIEHWHNAMQSKYFTYIHLIDPLIKRMAERHSGVILNIVGSGGKVANPSHLAGGAANAALMLASAGLATAYGRKGIRVNVINPGRTQTERLMAGMQAEARQQGISADEALARLSAQLPLGRIATPQEIANAAVFLCSPCASYVSGATLAMDGALFPII